jgi:hypothetical protein
MKRWAFLGVACVVAVASFAFAQRHPRQVAQVSGMQQAPMQQQAALMYRAAMHQQAMLQRQQQAALAQQAWRRQAAWHANAQRASTVVVRPSNVRASKKNAVAQPVILPTQVTSRTRQSRGPGNQTVTRTNYTIPAYTISAFAAGAPYGARVSQTERYNPRSGQYSFKQTWTDNAATGSRVNSAGLKGSFTEQVSVKNGKEVIKQKWSGNNMFSSPAFAYLPLQVQMNQLEYLLPYRAWYNTLAPKTSFRSTISMPGGAQNVSTQIVNRYDRAGRFLGTQIQVKDTLSGKAAPLAQLTPQAQINLLEAAALSGAGYYPYSVDPLAYSWVNSYYPYRYGWTPLNRFGVPVWW